jgi:hypothetical protein
MHLYIFNLLLHMMLQIFVGILFSVAVLIVLQQNKQKLQELCHDTKKLEVEVLSHVLIEFLVRSPS